METPNDHGLKIADTPEEEELAPSTITMNLSRVADEAPVDEPGERQGSAQRLTPEEMDAEMERVQLLNGRPVLARDTYPD